MPHGIYRFISNPEGLGSFQIAGKGFAYDRHVHRGAGAIGCLFIAFVYEVLFGRMPHGGNQISGFVFDQPTLVKLHDTL